ncbi:MAG: HNH endonuclease [Balneolaceae bacterium]|nr:HNH endonuclease [Balneolaceae bacterium]
MTEKQIISALTKLRSDTSYDWGPETKGRAPHKPFLLLSVLDGVESGWIAGPQIELGPDLTDTFFTYWNAIMGSDNITTIALPFYHMNSESYWELKYKPGHKEFTYSPSKGALKERVEHAELDPDLLGRFLNPGQREWVRELLLTTYFNDSTANELWELMRLNRLSYDYSTDLLDMVAEPFEKYTANREEDRSREVISRTVRKKAFRRAIRRVYEDRCVLCRSRVIAKNEESLVDAAHIIPIEENGTDDPRNGLALCKTHHWMYDAFLLSVDPDYRIRLSGKLKREGKRVEDTLQWEYKEILLPQDDRFVPSGEALQERYDRFLEV